MSHYKCIVISDIWLKLKHHHIILSNKPKKERLNKYDVPFVSSLVLSRGPATAILGNDADVGVIAFVLSLQAGQVGWRGHTPTGGNFAQTLEPMSGSN